MKCPYCNKEMVKGHIYGESYKLKWLPEDKGLLFGIWAKDSIELGEGGGMGRARVKSDMCENCGKFIIDIKN